jgi:hypothetical protein
VRWCMRWLASQSNRASPPLSAKEQTLALQSSRSLRTSLIFLNGEKLKKLRGAKCDDTGGAMTIPRDSVSMYGRVGTRQGSGRSGRFGFGRELEREPWEVFGTFGITSERACHL